MYEKYLWITSVWISEKGTNQLNICSLKCYSHLYLEEPDFSYVLIESSVPLDGYNGCLPFEFSVKGSFH